VSALRPYMSATFHHEGKTMMPSTTYLDTPATVAAEVIRHAGPRPTHSAITVHVNRLLCPRGFDEPARSEFLIWRAAVLRECFALLEDVAK
jgi:hypothetical protein